jgi:hypothetical protein
MKERDDAEEAVGMAAVVTFLAARPPLLRT